MVVLPAVSMSGDVGAIVQTGTDVPAAVTGTHPESVLPLSDGRPTGMLKLIVSPEPSALACAMAQFMDKGDSEPAGEGQLWSPAYVCVTVNTVAARDGGRGRWSGGHVWQANGEAGCHSGDERDSSSN